MGKRRREQLNADAERLQVQRLGELVDRQNALLLSDLPAQYQAAFDQPLRTESKLRKYLEGLDGFELCEGDKPGTHCLRRKSSPPPQKKARREVRTTAENVISVEASPAPQSEFNPVRRAASPLQKLHDEILAFRDVVAPSSTERAAREDAFRTLERAAKSCWPNCEARVFGSALTKLELPSSDVDVVVFGAPVDKGSGGVAKRLRTLASALEDLGAVAPRCVIPRPFVRHRRGVRGGGVPVGWRVRGYVIDATPAWTPSQVPRGRRVRAHPPGQVRRRGLGHGRRRVVRRRERLTNRKVSKELHGRDAAPATVGLGAQVLPLPERFK